MVTYKAPQCSRWERVKETLFYSTTFAVACVWFGSSKLLQELCQDMSSDGIVRSRPAYCLRPLSPAASKSLCQSEEDGKTVVHLPGHGMLSHLLVCFVERGPACTIGHSSLLPLPRLARDGWYFGCAGHRYSFLHCCLGCTRFSACSRSSVHLPTASAGNVEQASIRQASLTSQAYSLRRSPPVASHYWPDRRKIGPCFSAPPSSGSNTDEAAGALLLRGLASMHDTGKAS